jgi:hypothetical protein
VTNDYPFIACAKRVIGRKPARGVSAIIVHLLAEHEPESVQLVLAVVKSIARKSARATCASFGGGVSTAARERHERTTFRNSRVPIGCIRRSAIYTTRIRRVIGHAGWGPVNRLSCRVEQLLADKLVIKASELADRVDCSCFASLTLRYFKSRAGSRPRHDCEISTLEDLTIGNDASSTPNSVTAGQRIESGFTARQAGLSLHRSSPIT